ncbi:hypothetical protein ERO13_A02G105400v2 [Gossypium hirsutum]|uniref:DET1- and DDB1-associated protein 1 domain-containing protein n=1 Tax=Gossypium barbadense TaxID=3634 RepID=A0A5J5WN44_GOSBA|nr:hypothetical protein ES319_A02G114000v1 [Gossypium barbadense]KAG4211455.1 hypothetical protein ERO13_A02G105400v2 [Gossypium hirsutum]
MMGSMLGDLPSFDPHNFSQLRPSDPSNPSWYLPPTAPHIAGLLHLLIKLRPKRAATEHPTPEHGCKQPRASTT